MAKKNPEHTPKLLLRQAVPADVPQLVPVCGHRYLPGLAGTVGYPVLSVYQTDIIVYGCDLRDYLNREFSTGGISTAPPDGPRYIEFWSRFID